MFVKKVSFIARLFVFLAVASGFAAPQDQVLIQSSDLTYLGGFALPPGVFGSSSFDYGGHALAPYHDPSTGKNTLFMEGHAWYGGCIAQVQIPANLVKSSNWNSLPQATVLQNFRDITDGTLNEIDPTNSNAKFVYGLLPYNGRLIVAASNVYSSSQETSHGVSGFNLSASNDFNGWYNFTSSVTAPPRAVGGPMATIPKEWQGLFGGPAMTGLFGISIVGATSAGPAATVFDPDNVGIVNPIPGKTVLFYPLSHPACGSVNCETVQSNEYNLTTSYGGIAFPPGGRSVLFIESHGTGCYWYGLWNEPGGCPNTDPYQPDVKGPHAPPYRYQIAAYDANDLLAVKNGTKQVWEPEPYAVWALTDLPVNEAMVKGAGYDPETGRLYITRDYGSQARVEVYQITVPGSAAEELGTDNVLTNRIDAFPNPFNPAVTISVGVYTPMQMQIYDINGRFVTDVTSKIANGQVSWNASCQPSGIYIIRVQTGERVLTKAITLMK